MVSVVISESIIKATERTLGFSEADQCTTYIQVIKQQECVCCRPTVGIVRVAGVHLCRVLS